MSENRLVIEDVTINRTHYLRWAEAGEATMPVGLMATGDGYDQLAAYVARGIATRRGEEVVTLRLDSYSITRDEVDGALYQLTTGAPSTYGGWSINYRDTWFTISAAARATVEGWRG